MASKKKAAARGPGRPPGSPTTRIEVRGALTRCPRCGSTERGAYLNGTVQEIAGHTGGEPFTHIVRRRCRCSNCGQLRIDRTYENRVPGGKDD